MNIAQVSSSQSKKRKIEVVDLDDAIEIEDEETVLDPVAKINVDLENIRKSALSTKVKQEPSISNIESPIPILDSNHDNFATLRCKAIRFGSYKYTTIQDLTIQKNEIIFKVPKPNGSMKIETIVLQRQHVIKVLVSYHVSLRVIFFYVVPSFASDVRTQLNMINGSDFYFDPTSEQECHKRITLVCENVVEDTRVALRRIFAKPTRIIDVLRPKEANTLLLKSCTKIQEVIAKATPYLKTDTILHYPSNTFGISICTEDYLCLAENQLLNDQIINFYLKYLLLNLPQDLQEKTHVFSTFFYSRLTQEMNVNKHDGVKTWTKNVDLFAKDFIVVPINKENHWFTAIICFPGMNSGDCFTKNNYAHENKLFQPPIKQPSILILDSIAGASKEGIAQILRDYLTSEYTAKKKGNKVFNNETMKYSCPESPQQQNGYDCGLYLLQNVENFFKCPITDYRIPIQNLKNWYSVKTTTNKRKDIAILIQELMIAQHRYPKLLPKIEFPTLKEEIIK